MALVFFTEDESNCITLRAKIETGAEEAFEVLLFTYTSLPDPCP